MCFFLDDHCTRIIRKFFQCSNRRRKKKLTIEREKTMTNWTPTISPDKNIKIRLTHNLIVILKC